VTQLRPDSLHRPLPAQTPVFVAELRRERRSHALCAPQPMDASERFEVAHFKKPGILCLKTLFVIRI